MASYTSRIMADLEKQGAKVRMTKKGIMVTTSYGSTTLHNTPSDHRYLQNDAAELKRIGLEHPDVSKPQKPKQKKMHAHMAGEYPDYIKNDVSQSFIRQARKELWEKGWPLEVTTSDLSVAKTVGTKGAILYSLGYRWHPEGKKRGRFLIWVAPDEIVKAHHELKKVRETGGPSPLEMAKRARLGANLPPLDFVKPVGHEGEHHPVKFNEGDIPVPEVKVVHEFMPEGAIVNPTPQPEPEVVVHKEADMEFIDTRDSWVLGELPGYTTINSMREMANAMGLELEIRVWRKKTED